MGFRAQGRKITTNRFPQLGRSKIAKSKSGLILWIKVMRWITDLHLWIALKPAVDFLRRYRGRIRISHRKRENVGIINQITLLITRPFFLHGVHFDAAISAAEPPRRSIDSGGGRSSGIVLLSKSKGTGGVSGSKRREIEETGKWGTRRGVSGGGTAEAEGGGGERDGLLTCSGGIGSEEKGSRIYGEHYPKYWTQSDSSGCKDRRKRRRRREIMNCGHRRVHTQVVMEDWGWVVQYCGKIN